MRSKPEPTGMLLCTPFKEYPSMDETVLLTPREVAERLGLTVHQVYRRIHAGVLPAVAGADRNSQYLVPAGDVEAYVAAGQPGWATTNTEMLRVPQVARMTGFTDETIRRMCYEGIFSFVRGSGTRGHLRIHRVSVEDYLAGAVK